MSTHEKLICCARCGGKGYTEIHTAIEVQKVMCGDCNGYGFARILIPDSSVTQNNTQKGAKE